MYHVKATLASRESEFQEDIAGWRKGRETARAPPITGCVFRHLVMEQFS
jgi:hypothetical protein